MNLYPLHFFLFRRLLYLMASPGFSFWSLIFQTPVKLFGQCRDRGVLNALLPSVELQTNQTNAYLHYQTLNDHLFLNGKRTVCLVYSFTVLRHPDQNIFFSGLWAFFFCSLEVTDSVMRLLLLSQKLESLPSPTLIKGGLFQMTS